tara:strand:- start:10929 stop:11213 length:285 start_codon:yes stop_codon:yes gene_type:complete
MSEAPREHVQEQFEMDEGHTPVLDELYGISAKALASPHLQGHDIIHTHAKKLEELGHTDAVFCELLFGKETFWSIPRVNGNVYVFVKRDIARLA